MELTRRLCQSLVRRAAQGRHWLPYRNVHDSKLKAGRFGALCSEGVLQCGHTHPGHLRGAAGQSPSYQDKRHLPSYLLVGGRCGAWWAGTCPHKTSVLPQELDRPRECHSRKWGACQRVAGVLSCEVLPKLCDMGPQGDSW